MLHMRAHSWAEPWVRSIYRFRLCPVSAGGFVSAMVFTVVVLGTVSSFCICSYEKNRFPDVRPNDNSAYDVVIWLRFVANFKIFGRSQDFFEGGGIKTTFYMYVFYLKYVICM